MSRHDDLGEFVLSFGGCFVILIFAIIYAIASAVCWPYAINTWLELAGKEPVIVWWQGALIGFVPALGQLGIPAAVVTWIVLLFLV